MRWRRAARVRQAGGARLRLSRRRSADVSSRRGVARARPARSRSQLLESDMASLALRDATRSAPALDICALPDDVLALILAQLPAEVRATRRLRVGAPADIPLPPPDADPAAARGARLARAGRSRLAVACRVGAAAGCCRRSEAAARLHAHADAACRAQAPATRRGRARRAAAPGVRRFLQASPRAASLRCKQTR